jgi:hypothetical protein
MARLRTLNLAMLNIKTQPHSREGYQRLIKYVCEHRLRGKIRGSEWGIVGGAHDGGVQRGLTGNAFWSEYYIHGTVYRYLNIDPDAAWVDIDRSVPLEPGDSSIPDIDHRLKPNRKDISYVFFPVRHRIVFDTGNISPSAMRKFMASVFSDDHVREEFGQVDVEVVSSREAIDRILSIPRITSLDIRFTVPNDDIGYRNAEEILRRFEEMNIRSHTQRLTSNSEEGLAPDDELKAEMDIARENGRVTATGMDGEERVERSTEEHPLRQKEHYNPDVETETDAMLRAFVTMLPQ